MVLKCFLGKNIFINLCVWGGGGGSGSGGWDYYLLSNYYEFRMVLSVFFVVFYLIFLNFEGYWFIFYKRFL